MLTSKMIKQAAFEAGADLCGIGPMSRFNAAPALMNPQFLFPEAKSCIGFVFRIPRGVQRGIEEGTQFYQYPSMAYGGINEIFAPAVLYQVGKAIEDEGYEAIIVQSPKGLFRVVCASFDSRQEAANARAQFKADHPHNADYQKAWLLYNN